MVREAVFSMVASLVSPAPGDTPFAGMSCLDLFAGTGALGLEAMSRGAASCIFVESNSEAARALSINLGMLKSADDARVIRSDWRVALRRYRAAPVDLAFIDPPYEAGYYDEVMKTLLDCDIISDGGIVAVERSGAVKGAAVKGAARRNDCYEGFTLLRDRRYGRTLVEIYERTGRAPQREP
jgi:16S rRNA (guanine(966)-N(2))-methyltransferase RsmD